MTDATIILLVGAGILVIVMFLMFIVRILRQIQLQLNGRLDQLLLATGVVSHSEGVEEERLRERAVQGKDN